jgi:hypothetical protein
MLPVLPIEIVNKIFLYMHGSSMPAIKAELDIYEVDHNYDYTRMYKMYFIKNIISFSNYYFDKRDEPEGYNSHYHYMRCEE